MKPRQAPPGRGIQHMVIHVRDNFSAVFVARMIEWEHSIGLFLFGCMLMIQPDLFERTTSYAAFKALRPSADFWGLAAMAMGTMRFLVLLMNGTVRRSPHMRALLSFATAFFWFLAAMGGLVAGTWSQTTGLYISFVGWEFVIFLICMRYAKLEDMGVAHRVGRPDA